MPYGISDNIIACSPSQRYWTRPPSNSRHSFRCWTLLGEWSPRWESKYWCANNGQQVLFGEEAHFCPFLACMIRGKTPLWIKIRGELGENSQLALLIFGLTLLMLLQPKNVHRPTVTTACQPLRIQVERNRVNSRILWPSSQFLYAFPITHIKHTDDRALFRRSG